MRIQQVACGCTLIALVFLVAACDGNRMPEVTGTVKFNGQPIEDGAILFTGADGQPWGGPIKNGHYDSKVAAGPMKVSVSVLKGTGKKKKVYDTPESREMETFNEEIPAKYNSNTELQFEVKPGRNQKDWDLIK